MDELGGVEEPPFRGQRLGLGLARLEHRGVGPAGRGDQQLPVSLRESVEHAFGRESLAEQVRGGPERASHVPRTDRGHRRGHPVLRRDAEDPLQQGEVDALLGGRDQAFEDAQAVTHRTVGHAGHAGDRDVVGGDRLGLEHRPQVVGDPRDRDRPEVEPLAAALDRRKHLVRLGRAQDELHVRRRLLHGLQQRIERRRGEHVDLVDDVDLVRRPRRQHAGVGDQVPGILHAVVARAVDLDDVEVLSTQDRGLLGIVAGRGVQRPGEDPGHRRLPDAAGAAEEVGVGGPVLLDRPLEGVGDRLLSHDLAEGPGSIASSQDLVAGVGRGIGVGHGDPGSDRVRRGMASGRAARRPKARTTTRMAAAVKP